MSEKNDSVAHKYREAIEKAALRPDAKEALAELRLFDNGEEPIPRSPLRRPTSRKHQMLLAGLCCRASQFEEVGPIMGRTGISTLENPADAVIIDPGFVHLEGHHYNSNVYFSRLVAEFGKCARTLRIADRKTVFSADETRSLPTFSLSPYERIYGEPTPDGGLQAQNDLYRFELCQLLQGDVKPLFIVHTARHNFVEAVCRYFAENRTQSKSSLLLWVIEAQELFERTATNFESKFIYQKAFAHLKDLEPGAVMVAVETEAAAESLREFSGFDREVIVAPYVGGFLCEADPEPGRHAGSPTIGFAGQTRPERGCGFIPELARRLLAASPHDHRWLVQLDAQRLAHQSGQEAAALLPGLVRTGQFELAEPNLSVTDYFSMLSKIDIMVMPYSQRYENTGSGIGVECLNMGIVQVVPSASTMADAARRAGAGLVTFESIEIDAVERALIQALDEYALLQRRSAGAAATLRRHSPLAPIVSFVSSALGAGHAPR